MLGYFLGHYNSTTIMVLRYHPREILFAQQASMAHSYEKGPLKSGIYFFPLKLKYELAFLVIFSYGTYKLQQNAMIISCIS